MIDKIDNIPLAMEIKQMKKQLGKISHGSISKIE
jgi:hypothetical protein